MNPMSFTPQNEERGHHADVLPFDTSIEVEPFITFLQGNESSILERTVSYVRKGGHAEFMPTLEGAWLASIRGLSRSICCVLKDINHPEKVDEDLITHFGRMEAIRHRQRGVSLPMFLGCMKCFCQSFLDALDETSAFSPECKIAYAKFINWYFARVEVAFTIEWMSGSTQQLLQELQVENLRMTNVKNKYLTVFESFPQPIILLNDDHSLENLNVPAQRLLGVQYGPGGHYYGQDKDQLMSTPSWLLEEAMEMYDSEAMQHSVERLIPVNGELLPFEIRLQRMKDISGKFTGTVALLDDLTPARRFEELQRAKEETDRVNRKLSEAIKRAHELAGEAKAANACKTEFLASMSHEIRTPMNAVIGMASLLETTSLTPEQQQHVNVIKQSGELLTCVISDILDLAQVEAGKLQIRSDEFEIRPAVESTIAILAIRAGEKSLELGYSIDTAVPRFIHNDVGRVRQILCNLLSNSIKFTRSGQVNVLVSMDDPQTVRFRVCDTGIGIPEMQKDKVFQAFCQLHECNEHGGTGLGLRISKCLAELMGGTIGFESQPGDGSTFWFSIPVVYPPGARQTPSPVPHDATPRNPTDHRRILVAEDNPTNQLVVRKMLEKMGLCVDVVSNGCEAVDAMKNRSGVYDAILMDLNMPEMDGREATAHIRQLERERFNPDQPRIPIIALTACVLRGELDKCLNCGMDDFLSKPVRLGTLQASLGRWLS